MLWMNNELFLCFAYCKQCCYDCCCICILMLTPTFLRVCTFSGCTRLVGYVFSQMHQTKCPIIFQRDYAPQLSAYESSVVHIFANIWYYQISKLFTNLQGRKYYFIVILLFIFLAIQEEI